MGTVPRDRAGMASGISTTARFSGILLGFAVLSGVLATVTRTWLMEASCIGGVCGQVQRFADAVAVGDLPRALASLDSGARAQAMDHARLAHSSGFSVSLAVAAGVCAALVGMLMREGR